MGIASWLLVTTAFVNPIEPQSPVAGTVPVDVIVSAPAASVKDQQPQSQRVVTTPQTPTPQAPSHQLGLGTSITATNNGIGGSFRFWFNEHLGTTFQAQYYRSRRTITTVTGTERVSGTQVAPSLIYLFGSNNGVQPVKLRPYVGGGLSYSNTNNPTIAANGTRFNSVSGFRETVYGGAELWLEQYPSMTINSELGYTRFPTVGSSTPVFSPWNYTVSVNFYLR